MWMGAHRLCAMPNPHSLLVRGGSHLVGVASWGDDRCLSSGFTYRVDIADTPGSIQGLAAELE